MLALVLSGVVGGASSGSGAAPPPVIAVTPTPVPGTAADAGDVVGAAAGSSSQGAPCALRRARVRAREGRRAIVGDPSSLQAHRDLALYQAQTSTHIAERWMQGFYPIYADGAAHVWGQLAAARLDPSAGVGLLDRARDLLGAQLRRLLRRADAVQRQERGPPGESDSTWALVSDSYRYGQRPASYDHMTAHHPSIYDDFDAIMAAAHLLSADGAGYALDGTAWNAAYDYYGHDLTGVTYADQVVGARDRLVTARLLHQLWRRNLVGGSGPRRLWRAGGGLLGSRHPGARRGKRETGQRHNTERPRRWRGPQRLRRRRPARSAPRRRGR